MFAEWMESFRGSIPFSAVDFFKQYILLAVIFALLENFLLTLLVMNVTNVYYCNCWLKMLF